MDEQELKYYALTRTIIGCPNEGSQVFWAGFPEIVYQRALMIELKKAGLSFKQEVEGEIIYENIPIYKRRLDIIVENIVLFELKAQKTIDKADYNEVLNYL